MDTNQVLTMTHRLALGALEITARDEGLEFAEASYQGASEDAEQVRATVEAMGLRTPAVRELLLTTLIATQSAQIMDLRERVAHLELEKSESAA